MQNSVELSFVNNMMSQDACLIDPDGHAALPGKLRIPPMAYSSHNLSVLAYANGFIIWRYASPDDAAAVDTTGYFNSAADMLRVGDMILANVSSGGSAAGGIYLVNANQAGVVDVAHVANLTPVGALSDRSRCHPLGAPVEFRHGPDEPLEAGDAADSPEPERKIIIPCQYCQKPLEYAPDSLTAQGVFNSFCNDSDCEDRFAAAL